MTLTPGAQQLNILILGGLTHLSRALLVWLIADDKHSSREAHLNGAAIKHVRIVDKFLVLQDPPTSTTFVDAPAMEVLADPRVEYRQANLNMPAAAAKAFEAGESGAFDIVFDLTGEGILGMDVPTQLLLERTTKLAALLASEAAKAGVKAYVRDTPNFWKSKPDEGLISESTDPTKRSLPKGPRAFFWYEAERAVANVEGLPVGLLRSAGVLGPGQYHGDILPRIAFGQMYALMREPLKTLWTADLRLNTIHSEDWCTAAWSTAMFVASRTRHEADEQAGQDLPPIKPKDKKDFPDDFEAQAEKYCPRSKTVRATVFNVVDDGDTDQGKFFEVIHQFFKIETGFVGTAINTWAKLNLESVLEDMNEKHAEACLQIMAQSDMKSTPFNPILDLETVAQRAIALDGSKIRRVLGWKPTKRLEPETVKETVRSFVDAGVWRE